MTSTTATLPSQTEGLTLTTYTWEEVSEPKAVVQLSHGLAEHAGRYDRLATALDGAGYLVYAHDHPGHGATGEAAGSLGSFGGAGWAGLVADVATVGRWIGEQHGAVLAGIRKDLPILVVSGDADPLAGGGALVEVVGQRDSDAGITDVTVRLFPEVRHEIFNETNRDEITALVINWLDAHTS